MDNPNNFFIADEVSKFSDECDTNQGDLTVVSSNEDIKRWDLFRTIPIEDTSGSLPHKKMVEAFSAIAKVLAYILTFSILLAAAVCSKGTLLFMTSQIRVKAGVPNVTTEYCNTQDDAGPTTEAAVSLPERVSWIWAIFFCFTVPEFFTWFRSVRICVFRRWQAPSLFQFLLVGFIDTLHVFGLALFVYIVLPNLKVTEGLMLCNCFCLIPGVLNMLSRNRMTTRLYFKLIADVLSIAAQLSGLILWAGLNWVTNNWNLVWVIPVSLFLTSIGWWENYCDPSSPVAFVRYLSRVEENLKCTRYFSYTFLSLWRTFMFFIFMLCIELASVGQVNHLFSLFSLGFNEHPYNVTEVEVPGHSYSLASLKANAPRLTTSVETFISWPNVTAYVFVVHAVTTLFCFLAGKFACKIRIQRIGFSLPINLAVPVTLTLLITFCRLRIGNACMFADVIPPYLFFDCPDRAFLSDIPSNQHWVWVFWMLSQAWITAHIWTPKAGRLARTEQLFTNPFYNAFLVEQSMAMNRRRDDDADIKTDEINLEREGVIDVEHSNQFYGSSLHSSSTSGSMSGDSLEGSKSQAHPSDSITRLYTCATMWHETADEIVTFLKSILYLDEDQCARRIAQKYLKVVDPEYYYEMETHIFFDDAFELSDEEDEKRVINPFVKLLINCLDEAASKVHQTNVRIRAPKKYPTPYGGRLIWTLPGKTKIICHLKDKQKIRIKKRWSQVMYMYYLLGHKLMELPISVDRKAVIAQNTYLLALDGDMDFMPNAVQLLVDLMKRNPNLAAACGRVHPVGTGLMAWYQRFEYAIGHWLQKATENMIGCVLCSPGCFSLFRGKCLMDDNVMAKYATKSSEARHFVQYDQGEDRWLSTLLLQRGYRVEYCAASDAYTHCPEGFNEFYNQRRRWVPSTMTNILELLFDYKRIVKINDSISFPYVWYQMVMIITSVLGPGTVFLMIVGSFNVALGMDNRTSICFNLVTILAYTVICMTCKPEFQLFVAQILSAIYSIVMMALLVGIIIQLCEQSQDGLTSPSTIVFVMTAGTFVISALLHPSEFWCLPFALVYYLAAPSMHLLLIIYSACNLNNVSWGTRELPQKKKKVNPAADAAAAVTKAPAQQKKATKSGGAILLGLLQRSKENNDAGSTVHRKPDNGGKQQLLLISESLAALNKRFDSIDKFKNPSQVPSQSPQTISSRTSVNSATDSSTSSSMATGTKNPDVADINLDSNLQVQDQDFSALDSVESEVVAAKEERDNLVNPYWMENKELSLGTVYYLDDSEMRFWKEMIKKYLFPIDEDKAEKAKISLELKELRDKVVLTFLIINALYVTVVFLLTLKKDTVYIRWPVGMHKYNVTYDPPTAYVEYLHLEPISSMFVFIFVTLMAIQFVAMLSHRLSILSQILASRKLACCHRKAISLSNEAYLRANGVKIARNLQQLRGVDDHDQDYSSNAHISCRRTIHNLEKRQNKREQPSTGDLTSAFRKRVEFLIPNADFKSPKGRDEIKEGLSVRRENLKLLAGSAQVHSILLAEVNHSSSVAMIANVSSKNRRPPTLNQPNEALGSILA